MIVRSIRVEDLPMLAEFAAPLQSSPGTMCVYLAEDAAGIESELLETTWHRVGVVAEDAGVPVGWAIGDIDDELGRVWWLGPFATATRDEWASVASTLLTTARTHLPPAITEEEMAVDDRADATIEWSRQHGFEPATASFVAELTADARVEPPDRPVRPIADRDHARLSALHDELFPGTHTPGAQLVTGHDERRRRLVTEIDGRLAGYIAVERQADGSGYIDYLGVDPAMRRRGIGADLVRAGIHELRRVGAQGVSLTVRVDATGAQELYESLGFDIGRRLVPLRRGFSVR